jgi:3D (Asp-Asp-Asp) domain-containing protein
MLPATYTTQFLCTGYIIASQADHPGGALSNAGQFGLAGQYPLAFLRDVMLQGSGQATDGDYIQIDWANVPHGVRLTMDNVAFRIVTQILTASGRPLVGTSIAVDPKVIPLISGAAAVPASVTIQPPAGIVVSGGNTRTVDDTGIGRIHGYHIDVFFGVGRASLPVPWGNPTCTLVLNSY